MLFEKRLKCKYTHTTDSSFKGEYLIYYLKKGSVDVVSYKWDPDNSFLTKKYVEVNGQNLSVGLKFKFLNVAFLFLLFFFPCCLFVYAGIQNSHVYILMCILIFVLILWLSVLLNKKHLLVVEEEVLTAINGRK